MNIMKSDVFSAVDITIEDHTYESIKYIGDNCESSICFCAISQSANSLISALTDEFTPIGYFIITISDILNPIEYSNGDTPSLMFIRSYRNEIYKNGNVSFVCFSESDVKNQSEITKAIYKTINPTSIVVFDSQKKSKFIGKSEENTVYTFGMNSTTTFPSPDKICGLSASLFIESMLHKDVKCMIYYLCESDDEPITKAFEEWTNILLEYIENDASKNSIDWKCPQKEELISHALHNLLVLQGGTIPTKQ